MALGKDKAIIILAAGNSSRMGSSKQMLSIGNGTLLEHTVDCALASGISKIVVVLGAKAEDHQRILVGRWVDVLVNPDWERGMGSSLKVGMEQVLKHDEGIRAIMVLVCDQPLLTARHINTLASEYTRTKSKAVASLYKGVYGVPAIFDRCLFSELMAVDDQTGARSILKNSENSIGSIIFEGGEVDLDTREDYQNYISRKGQ
jgi:molybdenum cofactor cytidylyltransferase